MYREQCSRRFFWRALRCHKKILQNCRVTAALCQNKEKQLSSEKKIKYWLYFFIVGLFLSGLTAIPLEWQMEIANRKVGIGTPFEGLFPGVSFWVTKIYTGLSITYNEYPFIAYGTDWLAFAHFVLAILFVGPLKDPVRNIWVIEFGMIACVLVIPFAMVFGAIRDIPLIWRMADCSFGVVGMVPLYIVRKEIQKLSAD